MVLKLSRAALLAATIGLAVPAAFALPAVAQEKTQETQPNEAIAFEIKIPSVVAVDSSMSEDQIKDVFTANFLTHADQLAALSATSITIPELTLVLKVNGPGGGTSTVTYRDIVLTNVKDGHAEKMSVGAGEANSQGETTVYRAIAADGFDLKRLLEFGGIVKGDPAAPFKAIYAAATSGGSSQSGPLYSCDFGPTNSSSFEARPTKFNLTEFIETVKKYPNGSEPPAEVLSSLITQVIDLVRGFRGGASTVGAIDCKVPGELPITVKIAGASTTDFEPAIYPNIKVSGLAIDAGPLGNGSLGEFLLKTIDFNSTLDALEGAAGQLSDAWFEKNWRLLLPSMEGLSLANFAIDAINPDSPNGERIQAKLANFDLSLGEYLNGIPTVVSATLAGLEVPLPQDSADPQIATLLAAGLTGVNLGADVAANWDRDSKTIAIQKLAMSAVDLGSMNISADIGNATEQLFAVDPETAMMAGFGITVKKVEISVTDDGLGQIVWPLAAAQEGTTDIEAYRTQMAGFAEGIALQLLGSTDAARQLGTALGDFVTGRKGAITITITSRDPNGIPLPLFMAAQEDPTVLTGQIDVTGTAQ
jgi:hypothetical protein